MDLEDSNDYKKVSELSIGSLFDIYKINKVSIKVQYSIGDYKWMERRMLVDYIKWRLNNIRRGTTFRQLSYPAVLKKVQHLDAWDLKFLVDKCEKAKNFSACFFGELKVK